MAPQNKPAKINDNPNIINKLQDEIKNLSKNKSKEYKNEYKELARYGQMIIDFYKEKESDLEKLMTLQQKSKDNISDDEKKKLESDLKNQKQNLDLLKKDINEHITPLIRDVINYTGTPGEGKEQLQKSIETKCIKISNISNRIERESEGKYKKHKKLANIFYAFATTALIIAGLILTPPIGLAALLAMSLSATLSLKVMVLAKFLAVIVAPISALFGINIALERMNPKKLVDQASKIDNRFKQKFTSLKEENTDKQTELTDISIAVKK